ncbi:MAG: Fic family protein [Treponema sp.]|jgi:Fic family protein|nr:Fic family protein [Treponema sp.]
MKNTLEHISFKFDWKLEEITANLLGQCYAYVNAMLNTPIRPDHHQDLLTISLNKGALASTAIEGNTLTEEELIQIQSGKNLAPSKKYQQQEVENVLYAFNTILKELIREKKPAVITPELLRRFHKMIGENIGEAFGGNPGQFRRQNVVVGNVYRPPSFEKVEEYTNKLCDWLLREFHYTHGQNFDEAVLEAIIIHVYIAWIHPFMDGNGRTARLLEFYLLMRAGVPSIASHIMSNHYNDTRSEYYRQLQNASNTGDLKPFIQYALQGFRDGLEKIIEIIQKEQAELTWKNYVHDITEKMQADGLSRKTTRRIKQLAYYIPPDRFYSTSEIRILHINIAEEYQGLSPITLRRDLELLVEKDLLKAEKNRYCSNYGLLHGFLPEASTPIRRHY